MRLIRCIGLAAVIMALLAMPARAEASAPNVAALQVALKSLNLYPGHVDGIAGPLTKRGTAVLQRRRGLPVDGVAGARTRKALGWRGRPPLGSRVMRQGARGWDVAALQYLLQRGGFGAGRADGIFGPLTHQAVVRAQRASGARVDGLAGPRTVAWLNGGTSRFAARGRPSGRFARPVNGPIGDRFGVRRGPSRVHQGLDFPVPKGTRVNASASGTTISAGYNTGGYGNLVVIQHAGGYTTWYAHLSSITIRVGQRVRAGRQVGRVGSTGYSTGPHLHFEIRRFDSPVDPARLLMPNATRYSFSASSSSAHHAHGAHECEAPRPRRGERGAGRGTDWIARERLC